MHFENRSPHAGHTLAHLRLHPSSSSRALSLQLPSNFHLIPSSDLRPPPPFQWPEKSPKPSNPNLDIQDAAATTNADPPSMLPPPGITPAQPPPPSAIYDTSSFSVALAICLTDSESATTIPIPQWSLTRRSHRISL
jgi:hypothetical protein